MLNGQKESGDSWTKAVAFLSTKRATNRSWRFGTPQKPTPGCTAVSPLTNTVRLKAMSTSRWTKGKSRRRLKAIFARCWKSKSAENREEGFLLTAGPQEAQASYCRTQSIENLPWLGSERTGSDDVCISGISWSVGMCFWVMLRNKEWDEIHPKVFKQKEIAKYYVSESERPSFIRFFML